MSAHTNCCIPWAALRSPVCATCLIYIPAPKMPPDAPALSFATRSWPLWMPNPRRLGQPWSRGRSCASRECVWQMPAAPTGRWCSLQTVALSGATRRQTWGIATAPAQVGHKGMWDVRLGVHLPHPGRSRV